MEFDLESLKSLCEGTLPLKGIDWNISFFLPLSNLCMLTEVLDDFRVNLYTWDSPVTLTLLSIYCPIFFLAFAGNILVITAVHRHAHMRKTKNYFLVNLSIADLLVTLVCIPMAVSTTVYRAWPYGDFVCKLVGFLQGVAVSASIFSLTVLSFDRYLAIRHPMLFRRISSRRLAFKLIIIIWIQAVISMGPLLFVRQLDEFEVLSVYVTYCIERWPSNNSKIAFGIFLLVIVFIVPSIVITVCYSIVCAKLCTSFEGNLARTGSDGNHQEVFHNRRRIARMLIVLVIAFVLCWLPYNIISVILDITSSLPAMNILPFALLLGHAHAAINPIIYWLLNKSFRRSMTGIILCRKYTDNSDTLQSVIPRPLKRVDISASGCADNRD